MTIAPMRRWPLSMIASIVLATVLGCTEPTHIAEPVDNYILGITHDWGRTSPLGDLRTTQLGRKDLELRFWSGYGMRGVEGLVLRRTNGAWDGWQAHVVRCFLDVPIDTIAETTFSDSAINQFLRTAVEQCGDTTKAPGAMWRVFEADTIALTRLARNDLAQLWDSIVSAGIDTLPTDNSAEKGGLDGHGYVVELRRGRGYRASIVSGEPDTTRTWAITQRLAKIIEPISWPKPQPH